VIASRSDASRGGAASASRLRGARAAGLALGLALATGCASGGGMPNIDPIEPPPTRRALVPDDPDLAARDVAVAALAGDEAGMAAGLARLEQLDAAFRESEDQGTGLVPVAHDLVNAARHDPAGYAAATETLLDRDDIHAALRTRLEQVLEDEPLRLAAARRRDAWVQSTGQVVNALAAPLGRAATNLMGAAIGLSRAVVKLAVNQHLEDELSLQERQALAQEKRFLRLRPDDPHVEEVQERVLEGEALLAETHRDRAMRRARRAMQSGDWRVAVLAADRALRFAPEDTEATELREEAAARIAHQRAEHRRSIDVAAGPDVAAAPEQSRALAEALLLPGRDLGGEASRLLEQAPEGPLADEARFARAIALGEQGDETAMWELLDELGEDPDDPDAPNMARHAALLVANPHSNPYGAFLAARGNETSARAGWVLLGPLAGGARDRDLPRPVEWLVEVPTLMEIVTGLPSRILRYPWLDANTFGRAPERWARAYLARFPDGEYAPAVRRWLVEEEMDAGRWPQALELAQQAEGVVDDETLAELRENTAASVLEIARSERRRDTRILLEQRVAREFPDTEAGREAGNLARKEVATGTAQGIRITRNFLQENPRVAGTEGFGLKPVLLDGELRNGELHPEGVVLAGRNLVELRFVAESGDEEDPPVVARKAISEERLARVAALLEEESLRNELLDSGYGQSPDALRDLFLERARLGVTDQGAPRPAAESNYVFTGLRDRYGLVRGRESILPIDIVLQGSFPDLGLAAFPRVRMPKKTPDAILYK